jgi:membrane-bound lytic murein transglycosylase
MPINNFSSIGGYAVGSTEVLNTANALKNISAMHMVSDQFSDANKDVYIMKRQTDAGNNTQQLTLDGATAVASNSARIFDNSVAFITARIFGQETTTNTYVYATQYEVVVTTDGVGNATVASQYENVIRSNPPGQESWSVTPDVFTIGTDAYFTFEVASVTSSSTVKWVGILEITVVS